MVTAKEQEAPVASKLRRSSGIRYGSARDKFGSPGGFHLNLSMI